MLNTPASVYMATAFCLKQGLIKMINAVERPLLSITFLAQKGTRAKKGGERLIYHYCSKIILC